MTRHVGLRSGAYQDSVTLMQVSREVSDRDGVRAAFVAMATELNLELLVGMGFVAPEGAGPNDMVVAVEAEHDAALEDALSTLDAALSRRPTSSAGEVALPPPTVSAAARRTAANLALVSTPGPVAAIDAADALGAGLDVMVFSDNVSVLQEVALKDLAAAAGLLVMGPDCGTAVVGGVGLGFANVVRPGPVGIVAASGTGAQHLMCLLDGAGIGVTHCLGVGGRDLSVEVAGRSTREAIDRLGADTEVTTIVVVSKPPAEQIAADVTSYARTTDKDVVVGYLGVGRPDLTATAAAVAESLGREWRPPRSWGILRPRPSGRGGRAIRGLYSGGTLCDEAMIIVAQACGPVASNIPLAGHPALDDSLTAAGHTFIDFGDDALTAGRPHPMIDGSLRLDRLRTELADPDVGVVLLDVVLGHAAHPDPAAELAPVIADASTPVVVALVGTRDDPQDLERTADRLAAAGALVHASNAEAARSAVDLVGEGQ